MKKVFKSLFLGLAAVGMFFTGCQIDEETGNLAVLALAGSGGKTITGICFSEDCDLDSSAIGSKNDAQELTVGQTYPIELVYNIVMVQ